jgi:hypothetical protein
MEERPSWETNTESAWEEIRYLLWNPKVHYRVYINPPVHTILNEPNQARVWLVQ